MHVDPKATIGDISAQMTTAPTLPAGAQILTSRCVPTEQQDIAKGTGESEKAQ